MLNNFVNSLSATGDYWFAASHCLQIHTSKSFVAAREHKYGTSSHGICHRGSALTAQKPNSLTESEFARQCFQSCAIGTFPDDLALQIWKQGFYTADRPQGEFLAFAGYQVADDKDFLSGRGNSHRSRRKQFGIRPVVNHSAADIARHSIAQNLPYLFADAYDDPGRTVDVHRYLPPPSRRNPPKMAIVKHIQPVNRHHERNIQTPGKQRRRVAARQRGVSVDHVNRLHAV